MELNRGRRGRQGRRGRRGRRGRARPCEAVRGRARPCKAVRGSARPCEAVGPFPRVIWGVGTGFNPSKCQRPENLDFFFCEHLSIFPWKFLESPFRPTPLITVTWERLTFPCTKQRRSHGGALPPLDGDFPHSARGCKHSDVLDLATIQANGKRRTSREGAACPRSSCCAGLSPPLASPCRAMLVPLPRWLSMPVVRIPHRGSPCRAMLIPNLSSGIAHPCPMTHGYHPLFMRSQAA